MPDRPRYTVAKYIVDRLAALGVGHVFQVPGNYTAQFLLEAERSGKLKCIGTTNEQEAGYAADAYARLYGLGVLCTTYGVGSLSAMNAIAGARVELCPVVLINGGPNRSKTAALEEYGVKFAHAIDTQVTDERLFRELVPTAVVTDPADAPEQIDAILRTCITTGLPVYLESRDGVWDMECREPADQPLRPLQPSEERRQVEQQSVEAAVAAVVARLMQAKSPILWGGEELQRLRLEPEFEDLVQTTGLKYSTTLMAKSLLPETAPERPGERRDEFIGVYDSVFAPEDVARVVENSDCVIALGTILSDFYGKIVERTAATGSMVLAAAGAVRVGHAVYPNIPLALFVPRLLEALKKAKPKTTPPQGFDALPAIRFAPDSAGFAAGAPGGDLSWHDAFVEIQKHVDANTLVLADTSLALFPSADLLIPARKRFVAQTCWLSIGYTLGAAVGACARLSKGDRLLVLVGDGGFQMGPQALATLAKLRAPATVVVFDNALYAVEQFLVVTQIVQDQLDFYRPGSERPGIFFNRLEIDGTQDTRWDYVALGKAFRCHSLEAKTPAELDSALAAAKQVTDRPTLIAARIDPRSVPPELERAVRPAAFAAVAGAAAPAGPTSRISPRAFN